VVQKFLIDDLSFHRSRSLLGKKFLDLERMI